MEKDYKKLLLEDDIYCAAKAIQNAKNLITRSRWTNARGENRVFNKYLVVGDDNPVACITVDAFDKYLEFPCSALVFGSDIASEKVAKFSTVESYEFDKRTAVLLSVDCNKTQTFADWFVITEEILKKSANTKSICIVSVILPDFPDLPSGIGSLAEREFEAHMRLIDNPSLEQQNWLKVEELCRKATKEYGSKIILLRMANVFGPGYSKINNWDLRGVFNQIFENKEISISNHDIGLKQSLTYTVDAVGSMFHMLYNGIAGNIYNVASFAVTLADIKMAVYDTYKEFFSLNISCLPSNNVNTRCLSRLKYNQSRYRLSFNLKKAFSRAFCGVTGFAFVDDTNDKIYMGKLDRIKELEMDMLKEIDRICEKHNLKYFLAAGSLLGAKRYGHNIPWDDDLDVAFLRKDFEKFRKIVEKELNPKFSYCSWQNDAKSHYTVDKIRIKDSWYCTKYSSSKFMPDGVFVDILVYDATSDIPFLAKIHNKIAGIYQWLLLQVLWYDLKKKDFRNFGLYCLFKLINLIPLSLWHWGFEKWLKIFSFKRKPKFFIDGLGARAGIKLIPSEGLFDTIKIPFENGFMAASPENPEEYLKFAYGEDYLAEPPISEQKLHHNPARIDLGDSLFKNVNDDSDRIIHRLDLRGELFE